MSDIIQQPQAVEIPVKKVDTPIEILSKLKTWLSKYGYTFDETNLIDVIENVKLKKMHIGLEDGKTSFDIINLMNEIEPDLNEQTILVFPRGKHYIQKLDKWITFDDKFFNQIKDSFECDDLSKPFLDKNHLLEESFGDVTKYEITPDGMIFTVMLNNEGRKLVKENSYKYISPSFGGMIDTKGKDHENVLVSISLTNIPALMSSIPALQDQIKLELKSEHKGDKMNLTDLTRKLNLQDDASVTSIADTIQAMMDAGVEKDVLIKELQEALAAMTQEGTEQAAAMTQVSEELSQIKTAALEKEAADVIDLAITNGQYHPALKELKVKQFIADKTVIATELELLPKVDGGQTTGQNFNPTNLDTDDKTIMLERGLDPNKKEDVKLFNDANKGDK